MPLKSPGFVRAAAVAGLLSACAPAPESGKAPLASVTPKEAQKIGVDAYIYGYSLVTSEITREAFTNVAAPSPRTLQAPMGQFGNQPTYPPATYRGVTAPNADTLYSVAFIDVGSEPWIFSYPDMHGRFFLFPIYSLWTPVIESPGTRTLGTGAQTIAITGPGWHGSLPSGVTREVKSPTGIVLILGRVYADGSAKDYAAVHALQRQFKLYPLSAWGKPYKAPRGAHDPRLPSPKDKVRDIIDDMDTQTYFSLMAKTMKDNPPVLPEDAAMVAAMAKIGLVPGQPFDLDRLDPKVRDALATVGKQGFQQISALRRKGGKVVNGWVIPSKAGRYGTDYLDRAGIAAYGWGANLPQDAVYPHTDVDGTGQQLSGANKYVIHFAKGATPPVDGFWSITMYDPDYFFYPNKLNKLTVSPRNHLKYNADGSLDLHVQHASPGRAKEANWLPAPAGNFILMMRMYWPKETPPSILDGTWYPPPVNKAE